jgi:hypothetical protein
MFNQALSLAFPEKKKKKSALIAATLTTSTDV